MKHKKTITIGIILLAITFIVIALSNSTYALFSNDAYGSNNLYSTGMLSIEAVSKSENISLNNVLPMSDEEGLQTSPYVFTIKNVGNLDYLFDVKLLSTGDSSTTFLPQYIKLQVDDGEVTTLASLTNGEIKSDITLRVGKSIDISIRLWLSDETPNSEIGKSFNSKIVTDGKAVYTSTNNVNLLEHITSLYTSGNPTLITHARTDNELDTYYYSYQDDTKTWGLMNDGLKVDNTLDATTTGLATTVTDTIALTSGSEGNIRYFGPSDSVNNYIYFNCSDYSNQSDSTCEKWRIIGIVDGKVKLIRSESIGTYAWDSDDSTNNWKTSTLNAYLNGDYYNSLKTKNSKTIGLISESTYYLGSYSTTERVYSNQIYKYERTNDEGTKIYSGNPFTEDTNIGIMYASDYGYGTDFNECSSYLGHYNNEECYSNDWLFNSDYQWLINPNSAESGSAWYVNSYSNVDCSTTLDGGVYYESGVRPVLYLDSEVLIYNGDGSLSNPYQIYVEPTFAQYITKLYNNAEKETSTANSYCDDPYICFHHKIEYNYASSVSLMNDRFGGASSDYDDGNIRYYGENPNNYIYFNCSDYNNQSDDTCEKWRIIGVFGDNVKIIRDSIGNYRFNSEYDVWINSDLMDMLNNTYYYEFNLTTQNKIEDVTWAEESVGFATDAQYIIDAADFYSSMQSNWWNGKIGLMYASDYLYGIKDWMTLADNWTLTNNDYYYGEYVWITMGEGLFTYAGNGYTDSSYETNPTLYLKSTETLKGGDGSFDNPYQLLQE